MKYCCTTPFCSCLWRRQWHPTPVLLPGKSHGWRSLDGCSPWGRWGSDTTATSLSLVTFMHWRRKWQPTPVFLPENPRDRGAWWAAVYGVAQSRTRLKRLSSSSSFLEFPLHLPAQLLLTLQQSFHVSSFHFSPPKWNSSLFPLGYLITVYFTFSYTSLCFPLQKGLFPSW